MFKMLTASQVLMIIAETEEWFKEIRQVRAIGTAQTSFSFKLDYTQSSATFTSTIQLHVTLKTSPSSHLFFLGSW
jgi:hypothetical protein